MDLFFTVIISYVVLVRIIKYRNIVFSLPYTILLVLRWRMLILSCYVIPFLLHPYFVQLKMRERASSLIILCSTFVLQTGETRRKFESVYSGGTMDTPDSGKVIQYWHCCGSEDPFDVGCTAAPHASYDDWYSDS